MPDTAIYASSAACLGLTKDNARLGEVFRGYTERLRFPQVDGNHAMPARRPLAEADPARAREDCDSQVDRKGQEVALGMRRGMGAGAGALATH